ncbi:MULTISPECIES: hypothetical protein [Streptomyces]|uniref:Uncharacterized protein n=1 Tax=Streptomyces murinus TaxID=33900 RepID=A0A7W3RM24_STRMR|nr:hypothetical protein [Streptomyces murinus]MBA9053909.1 hypothetical protein [Streptomyces murinus]UWW94982.1 hypothetical protein GO605_32220 [Streptomyces murinus]
MDINAQLARQHRADLRARATAHHLATAVRPATELRTRVGWTLVDLGLRLVSAPRPALALAR